MKKTANHKLLDSMPWSQPQSRTTPRGVRWVKTSTINPKFVKLWQDHVEVLRNAGIVMGADMTQALWYALKPDGFKYPDFPKKVRAQVHVQPELAWRPPNADKLRADGLEESFNKLQEQFEEMQKLYQHVLQENERLRHQLDNQ